MNAHVYRPLATDSKIIIELREGFKSLTDLELIVKCLELKIKGLNGDHHLNLLFIALYYETEGRGIETPLRLIDDRLYFDEDFKKLSTMEKLIASGVKIVQKSGAILMPVSQKLADKINSSKNG